MAAKTYGATRVNSFAEFDQFSPAITALADGGYLVSWTTQTSSGRSEEIYAQRYDSSSNRVGGEIRQINTTNADDQCDPSVTLLNNGSYVISWTDLDTGSVSFQRYSSSGAQLGGETRIAPLAGKENGGVSVSALKNGGFVVTWESANGDEETATSSDIYAQRFDVNGNKLDSAVLVNTTIQGTQWSPAVVGLNNGGYLVVWESPVGKDGNDYGVYAQRFDSTGRKSGLETLINSTTPGYQGDPAVTKLAGGGYVISWQGPSGIYFQCFDANGGTTGKETIVTTTSSPEDPAIVGLSNGGFVVTWAALDGDSYGIYAQRFNVLGAKVGEQTLINPTPTGDQEDPVITALADGGYVIGWTSGTDVYSQRFDANGNKLSILDGDAYANTLTWTGSNSAIINGLAGNDTLTGNTGNDHLNGGAGDDRLNGGKGADAMTGGLGNDIYYVDNVGDKVVESAGAGTDTVYSYLSSHMLATNVESGRILSTGNSNLTGNSLNNLLYAGTGNNVLNGGSGIDTASYAYAASAVAVSLGVTTAQVTGGSGSDTLTAIENLAGSSYNDRLTGNSAANVLTGGAGNDTLSGGTGNDNLIGGIGKDVLSGGDGNDTFDFNDLREMGLESATRDVIQDFKIGADKIDLSTLDANTTSSANDAFSSVIGSTTAFTAAGQLKVVSGVLYGNTDADSTAEFAIQLTGISTLTTSDFVL